jgi:hypothetical protein
MIRQYADCDGFKGTALLYSSVSASKTLYLIVQKLARPIGENDRKKENAAFDSGSAIFGHRIS